MTETTIQQPGTSEEPLRCHVGSKTDNPCWREATERPWFLGEGEPTYCAEHAQAALIQHDADGLFSALYEIEEWISGRVNEERSSRLDHYAAELRDGIRQAYADTCNQASAARLIAEQGPPSEGEPRLTIEQSEELARMMLRADAFDTARKVLQEFRGNLPKDAKLYDPWLSIDALEKAEEETRGAVTRYRRGLGLRD